MKYADSLDPQDMTLGGFTRNTYFKGNLTFTQPLYAWGKIKAWLSISPRSRPRSRTSAAREPSWTPCARRTAPTIRPSSRARARPSSRSSGISRPRSWRTGNRRCGEGFATQEDVLSSTADLAALDTKLVQAREGEASALAALGLLTGLDPDSIVLVSPFREALPQFSEPSLKDEALASSTDVGVARARLSQARRKLDLERGSSMLLPNLSLFAEPRRLGPGHPLLEQLLVVKDNWSWDVSVGVAANVDLFDGGAAAARKREAAANLEAARIGEGGAEKAASLEARRAVEAAREAEAALREKEARAAWAAEALRNERAKAAGQASSRAQVERPGHQRGGRQARAAVRALRSSKNR